MITLSFIIPVFNLEKYIGATLDSILNNEFKFEYEIIVINDGSIDGSQQVVSSYMERYNNILLINNTNHGVSYSRNCGITYAQGKYVTFVDGDDTIDTVTYAHMVEQIEKGLYDFVQCNFSVIEKNGNRRYIQYCETVTEVNKKEDLFELFFSPTKLIHNSCWGKVINKECISKIRFDEKLSVSEDQKFVFDILCNINKILLMDEIGYEYYQREDSAIHTMSIEKCIDKITVLKNFESAYVSDKILIYIVYQKLLSLIELYNLMVKQNHKYCKEVRDELMQIITDEIFTMLSKRDRVKLFMINKINFLYKIAIKLFY